MKKIILGVILLILATSTFSQQTNPSLILTNQDYLKKSKHQKKVALIMLGGGATLVLTGIIIPKEKKLVREGYLIYLPNNDVTKGAFVLTGIVSMLGSIQFFIVSSKNKKKAAALSIKNEGIQTLQKGSFTYKTIPSLTLKFHL